MDETQFHEIADCLLEHIEQQVEAVDEAGEIDVELYDGVLTVTFSDGREWVINKHAPTQKIWISSPISGALYARYDVDDGSWTLKDGTEIDDWLIDELEELA